MQVTLVRTLKLQAAALLPGGDASLGTFHAIIIALSSPHPDSPPSTINTHPTSLAAICFNPQYEAYYNNYLCHRQERKCLARQPILSALL